MADSNQRIASFDNPPVIETVLGVQFLPLQRFLITHLGLYWAEIKNRYPNVEVRPPLSQVNEMYGKEGTTLPSMGIRLSQADEVRCWYIDQTRTHLIQIQKDRFILNWRKITGDEVYPRYDSFRPRFADEWKLFREFLAHHDINPPDVNQCEVTYVNHFEIGREWKSFADLPHVLTNWRHTSGHFLGDPEMVRFNSGYEIPEQRGRFHVFLQPVIRSRDAKQILQLNLTVRGKPDSSSLDDVLKFFDLGHEWIIKGFLDLTTPEMHKLWRRTL